MIEERPLLSFVLLGYNQEQFIAEAVAGALSQTYSPLEILISDDCSRDRTFEIMQQSVRGYTGGHRVSVRRNDTNLGLGAHINRVMESIRGELVIVAAGDDISLPERTERLWQEYHASGESAFSLFSNEYLIDASGRKVGVSMRRPPDTSRLSIDWFTRHQSSVTGSSQAWHQRTFDIFGPLGAGVISEDVVVPFRALLLGTIRYVDEPLVLRRYTGDNLSLGSLNLWDRDTSVAKFKANAERHAVNYAAVYATRLADLRRMAEVRPDRQAELEHIRAITQAKLERVQAESMFWQANKRGKFRALTGYFVPKRHYAAALRLAMSWLLPGLYMRAYHIASYRIRGKVSQEVR